MYYVWERSAGPTEDTKKRFLREVGCRMNVFMCKSGSCEGSTNERKLV
jgi:hypothetical protein